jgi:hypothetical protein
MASAVDICNRALQKLGADRITSLIQDTENARACNVAYQIVLDAELRSHPWNFAVKRAQLAADSDTPAFEYSYQYTLPSDFIRLLPPDPYSPDVDWVIEGRKILTDESAPLEIKYIYRVSDPNQFDTLFVEVLANRLAMELCEQLTQSNSKAQIIRDDYQKSVREARRLNAFEKMYRPEIDNDSWITVRV